MVHVAGDSAWTSTTERVSAAAQASRRHVMTDDRKQGMEKIPRVNNISRKIKSLIILEWRKYFLCFISSTFLIQY